MGHSSSRADDSGSHGPRSRGESVSRHRSCTEENRGPGLGISSSSTSTSSSSSSLLSPKSPSSSLEGAQGHVQDLLRDVRPFELPLKEKSSLGGMRTVRMPENDSIENIQPEAGLDVLHTIQEKTKLQTGFLLAKQKQIHLAGKAAAKRAEEADVEFYVAADKFARQCAVLEDVGPLMDEVQHACELLRGAIAQCERLQDELETKFGIPPEEPLRFPALEPATLA